jgi:outer membrane autotransporter protein
MTRLVIHLKELKMKKIAIATILAVTAMSASALEVGVTGTRDYAGTDRDGYGLTVGQSFGKVGVTAGFDRFTSSTNDQNRYSIVTGYDVANLGVVTVTPKVGVAYLDNQTGSNGYAMTVGIGASLPVTKQVSVGLDLARQYGQDRVNTFDGNRVTAGVRYKF